MILLKKIDKMLVIYIPKKKGKEAQIIIQLVMLRKGLFFAARNVQDEVEQLGEEIIAKYPDCKELLERYADAIHNTAACESLQDFERGFSLGTLIMLEVMTTE